MEKQIIAIITSTFMLLGAAAVASAQSTMQPPAQPQAPTNQGSGMMGPGMMSPGTMMRHRDMMGGGMMGGGMMGPRMMRGGAMRGVPLRIIFALMDSDGDGKVSLQEFQAAHEHIFKAMDTNKDGFLTLEEIEAFMTGRSSEPTK